jgi:Flp pilus assembly protein TadD
VRAQPDCVDARNNLAAVEAQQGKFTEADGQLRRAIQLRPVGRSAPKRCCTVLQGNLGY